MDISEYEIMKENKKLLENSLNKERELSLEITKLKEEKIKVLEDAKMKVVKVNKTIIVEHALRKNGNSINTLIDIMIKGPIRGDYSRDFYNFGDRDMIFDRCFELVKTEQTPFEEITTHGLDEVKAELKEEIKKNLDKDIIEKISRAEEIFKEGNKIFDRNKLLEQDNKLLVKANEGLIKEMEAIKVESEDYKFINNKLESIRIALSNGWELFNRGKLLDKVLLILQEKKQ